MKRVLGLLTCVFACLSLITFPVSARDASNSKVMLDREATVVNSENVEQFGVTEEQLTFYHSGADDMRLVNGSLVSSSDGEQKAIINESAFSSSVMEIEFSVTPASPNGAINHGVYFHAKNAEHDYQKIHALWCVGNFQ